ncbi:MAG: sugar ABC transporter substrate-binding protein [Clostridiales bacterium]|jgi:D-xylose transport system substrate-binding protein|nr:sugar ABC transporter substrate-binding protein [Clostridiales bacterium]
MKKIWFIMVFLFTVLTFTGCEDKQVDSKDTKASLDKIQIGLSFDSFVIERWQRDRDIFVSTAQNFGAEVNVQNANGDVKEQISQIEYLIDKKMDAIVVIATDSDAISSVLKKAKEAGIVTIAYDRLVKNADVDLYISIDSEDVGRLMAETLVEQLPDGGNIVTVYGSPVDHNVSLMEQGVTEVLSGSNLNVIYSTYAEGWLAEEAFHAVNEALKMSEEIDGVLCGNDDLASQAVRALSENRLAGKVVLTGQDADLAACQRIVEGTQTMTVYKQVNKLAQTAAEYAVKLVCKEDIDIKETIFDGSQEVPYAKLEAIAVTKDNIDEVIIEGGFQRREEVYLNISP